MEFKSLKNNYTQELEEKQLASQAIGSKIKESIDRLKHNSQQIQLGQDSKVDEAIMITLFASISPNILQAYQEFQKYQAQKQLGEAQRKVDNIKQFEDLNNKINKYTELTIRQKAIQKELEKNNLPQKEQEQKKNEIQKLMKETDEIVEFLGYIKDEDFTKEFEEAQEKWYGKEAAEYLKNLRELTPEALDNTTSDFNIKNISKNISDITKEIDITNITAGKMLLEKTLDDLNEEPRQQQTQTQS